MKKRIRLAAAAVLVLWLLPGKALAARMLVPGGQVVGLELQGDRVSVAGLEPTSQTALREGDLIVSVDGTPVSSAADVRRALDRSDGTVRVRILRGGREKTLTLQPQITRDGPRLGVSLRQGVAGVGTVTWVDPAQGTFGTLGHGVNDVGGGLLHLVQGRAYPAAVVSVRKGKSGSPGQLHAAVTDRQTGGTLEENTAQGVFGHLEASWPGEAMPTAAYSEIQAGPATIRATVSGGDVQEYSVEILKIYPEKKADGRNFLLKVTDPALLEQTGGIVQGMSGSPIIQNGRLVGAVTHVLVNQPDTGYGIYIEKMLDAAG